MWLGALYFHHLNSIHIDTNLHDILENFRDTLSFPKEFFVYGIWLGTVKK